MEVQFFNLFKKDRKEKYLSTSTLNDEFKEILLEIAQMSDLAIFISIAEEDVLDFMKDKVVINTFRARDEFVAITSQQIIAVEEFILLEDNGNKHQKGYRIFQFIAKSESQSYLVGIIHLFNIEENSLEYFKILSSVKDKNYSILFVSNDSVTC